MQYDFRAKSLSVAVRKSVARQTSRYARKSTVMIDSERDDYGRERLSVYVEDGRRYTMS